MALYGGQSFKWRHIVMEEAQSDSCAREHE
jgi:hypothetical protein